MTPLEWIALALMAAGTASNAQAQHKTRKAQAHVMGEERERRKAQQAKAEASARDTATKMTGIKDREAQRAAELTEVYRQEAPTATTTDAGTRVLATDAPRQATSTVQGNERARASALAEENQRTGALSKLGAFGDVFQESNIGAARNLQDIGMQQGFTEGWQRNVLPALYQKAAGAGRDWATAADIMKLASAVVSMGAMAAPNAAGNAAGEVTAEGMQAAKVGSGFDWSQPMLSGGAEIGSTAGRFGSAYGVADAASGAATANAGLTQAGAAAGGYDPYWYMTPDQRAFWPQWLNKVPGGMRRRGY
ncbi:MAG TPA: hypothetical protein VFB63_19415 [Bryobacteraceae bacterium]|nr:hypothetical protein [Bryobacteraceae bacterium]